MMDNLVETMPGANTMPPVLLLQGTGGTNQEILNFGRRLAPQSPLITVAGRHGQGAQRQYYQQTVAHPAEPGELLAAATWIAEQVTQQCRINRWQLADLVTVGYSNGAAMGLYGQLSGLLPGRLAVLFHPVSIPLPTPQSLEKHQIWLSGGQRDPFIQPTAIRSLADHLSQRGAATTVEITGGTHNLTPQEVLAARNWLSDRLAAN